MKIILLESYTKLRYKGVKPDKENNFVDFIYQQTTPVVMDTDTDQGWKKIKSIIAAGKQEPVHNKGKIIPLNRISLIYWMKIAVCLIIISGVFYILWFTQNNTINQVVTTTDNKLKVTFSDGSLGFLNSHSSLTYPKVFADIREVTLKGEAFFDIMKNTKPFIVNVKNIQLKVLGTSFNISSDPEHVNLFVESGTVIFTMNEKSIPVEANFAATYHLPTGEIDVKEVDNLNMLGWKNGVFEFENTPFYEVVNAMASYYDISFQISENLKNCLISVSFDKLSLQEWFDALETLLHIEVVYEKKLAKFKGKNCK